MANFYPPEGALIALRWNQSDLFVRSTIRKAIRGVSPSLMVTRWVLQGILRIFTVPTFKAETYENVDFQEI